MAADRWAGAIAVLFLVMSWACAGRQPVSTGESSLVASLNHGRATVLLVAFSPDSSAIATFVPGTLKVWNVSRWDKKIAEGPSGGG